MPRTIVFQGRTIQVPDDFSDDEISGVLNQSAAPKPTANAGQIDPRFFSTMTPGVAVPAAPPAKHIDPRYFTTMTPGVSTATMAPSNPEPADDPNNAGAAEGFSFHKASWLENAAVRLRMALDYGVQQDPDQYANLLKLLTQTGIPPTISAGNEKLIQQAVDANRIDPHFLTRIAPITSGWASNPDNAAVAGVPEIQRLAGIEQNAAGMRASTAMFPMGQLSAYTPTIGEKIMTNLRAFRFPGTGQSLDDFKQRAYEFPLSRWGIDAVAGTAGMIGDIGSGFFGWHGDGPTKENLLQRTETNLSPEANTDPMATFHKSTPLDQVAKQAGPLAIAALTGGTSLAATESLELSPVAARVLAGLSVGALFTGSQGGKTYTSVASAGGSDDDARRAANKAMAITALPNALFGATDVVPLLRDNPFLTSLFMGGLTGASDQVAQNVITGRPKTEGVLSSALQGAAMQGGMHLGMGAFGGRGAADTETSAVPPEFADVFKNSTYLNNLAQAVGSSEASKLRYQSPDKFYEATQAHFEGDPNLRIPSEQFSSYFNGKGMNPAEVAAGLGSTNYSESVLSGGDVEVPPADFLSNLDPEHQKALLPDVIDPSTGLTARQYQNGHAELEQWISGGGLEKWQAELEQSDPETAATPEWQTIQGDLRQRYTDAGQTPEAADTLATRVANIVGNLARKVGMQPSELLDAFNPKAVGGEAPGSGADVQTLHQEAIEKIRSVVEAANAPGDVKKWTVYAPVTKWLRGIAQRAGYQIDGFEHGIDADAIRHAKKQHGNEQSETMRGQLPITDADFEKIPHIVADPDRVIFGTKTQAGVDAIGYVKRLDDGTIVYVEEKRVGRKRLAAVTMWKYPAAMDVDQIATNFHPTSEATAGVPKPIIVRGPNADNSLHEPAAWPRVGNLSELTGNMDEAERRYDSLGQPNNIAGDRVKELLQGWAEKGNRPALEEKEHGDASKIAYNLFYRKAARLPEGSIVHLVTGPVAAGKSSIIGDEHDLVYEVNLSNKEKAFEHLDRLLALGLKPTVDYVYTTPEVSVERRASRAQADGRTVRIDRSTAQHLDLPGSIQAIADHYGDRVKIKIYDTSVHPTRTVPITELGKLTYTGTQEDLLDQQQRHLDSLRDSKAISPELHRQISRRASETRGRVGGERSGASEQDRGAEGSRGSGQEGVTPSGETTDSTAQFYADALTKKIADDPVGAEKEYSRLQGTDVGRILSADDARKLSEHYLKDKTIAPYLQGPATRFIADLFSRKLEETPAEGHDPFVLFTAGGTGAGKSSALTTSEGHTLYSTADIIFDSTLSNFKRSNEKIQQTLASGRDAVIEYIYRDPVEAFTDGVLKRAMDPGEDGGRPIPLEAHLKTHMGARATVEKLRQEYAGNPHVKFVAIDNSREEGHARVVSFDDLPVVDENELRRRLQDALKREFEAGRISKDVQERTVDPRRYEKDQDSSASDKTTP